MKPNKDNLLASEIAAFLQRELIGPDCQVTAISALDDFATGTLCFARNLTAAAESALSDHSQAVVLIDKVLSNDSKVSQIQCTNPRLAFAQVLQKFFRHDEECKIADTAVISHTATLGENTAVGEYSVIGDGVCIGDGSVVRDHVVIRGKAKIGNNCLIKSHAVIGEEGYGFEIDDNGTPIRIPHFGSVVIGNDVEIGTATVVVKGTLSDTSIGDFAKIDDHVFIAHNVQVGEQAMVIAGAEVSGSVTLGRGAWVGPQACILNGINVGERAMIGVGSVIIRDVAKNAVVAGNPGKHIRERE